MISALLLAAGKSERMGRMKQLMLLNNSTILEISIKKLLKARLDEIILVVGHNKEEILASLYISDVKLKIAVNDNYENGMGSSIAAGLCCMAKGSEAVLIALADQPFITVDVVNTITDAFLMGKNGIVIPVYEGKRGHPVVFGSRYFNLLKNLPSDTGARSIIRDYKDDILEINVENDGILKDIDTPDDYYVLSQAYGRFCSDS